MVTSTRAAFLFLVLSGPTHCIAMSAKSKSKASKVGKAPKGYDCESDGVSNIIMFGDSLVDVGNLNNFDDVCKQVFCGDRQSNGPLVAEFIADKLCINVTASTLSPVSIGGTGNNFAVTGARSGLADDGVNFESQVTSDGNGYLTFLAAAQNTTTPVVPPETLFFIWFGANDVRDALQETSELEALDVIAFAIAAIRSNIVSLIDAGACSFLVLGTINIALAPIVRMFAQFRGAGLGYSGETLEAFIAGALVGAEQLSKLFNTQLEAMLQGITITDSESCLGIKYVNTMSLVEDVVLSSDAYESKFGVFDPNYNVTDLVCNFRYNDPDTGASLDPNNGRPVLTEDEIDFECENFPFYDELHPATDLYELIAESFLDEVEDFAKGGARLLRRGL